MTDETVIVNGPMHPDLFGGETPMQAEVPAEEAGQVFAVSVDVEISASGAVSLYVKALNEDEAERIARAQVKEDGVAMLDVSIDETEITGASCRPATEDALQKLPHGERDWIEADFLARMRGEVA